MATILVADDEPDIRSLLTEILRVDGHTVQTAVNGVEALDKVQRRAFDLALVDLWLPDLTGLELLARSKKLVPDMPVIIITCRPACETAVLAMRLGACDFVRKPFILEDMRATVNRALFQNCSPTEQGGQWAADQLARARPWLVEVEQIWSTLTEREQQVLTELAAGKTDAGIAEALGISTKTAGNHTSSILNKLGVRSRTQATVWAMRAGIGVAARENSLRRDEEFSR